MLASAYRLIPAISVLFLVAVAILIKALDPDVALRLSLPLPWRHVAELGLVVGLFAIVCWAYWHASLKERQTGWIVDLCLAGFLLTVLSAFPGHTNFDELYSLSEYWSGTFSDLHPPLQTVAWSALMELGRGLGLGPVGQAGVLLMVQAAFFWSAAGMMAGWLQSNWLARAFLLILAVSPISLVYLGHIGKDSQMAIALFVAVAWLGSAVRLRSKLLLAASILPLFYGYAVRSNGPVAVLPLCLFWVIAAAKLYGFDLEGTQRKAVAALLSLLLFVGLQGLTQGFARLVVINLCCHGTQAFMTPIYDLMGVSVRVGQNLVPSAYYSEPDYDLDKIKQRFDPTTLNWDGLIMFPRNLRMLAVTSWIEALRQHPEAMIRHRLEVLANFFGIHWGRPHVAYFSNFYTGAHAISPPPRVAEMLEAYHKLSPQFFTLRKQAEAYFDRSQTWIVYKFWPYAVVFLALWLVPVPRPPATLDPVVWLAASTLVYVLPYLALANSAQFRYLWWPALALFAASVIRLDDILAYSRTGRVRAIEATLMPK